MLIIIQVIYRKKNQFFREPTGRFAKESRRDSRLGSEGTPTEPPGGAKRRFSIDSPLGLSTENVPRNEKKWVS